MMSIKVLLWSLILSVAAKTVIADLDVGDKICVEGFIMDYFCIARGRLLNNGRPTLEEPDTHSLHCLLDVGSCTNERSPFEVLIDPMEGGDGLYSRGFRLTDQSKADMLTLARRVGSCSTCDNGYSGQIREGFRAVINAEIVDLNSDSDDPAIIEATEMKWSNNLGSDPCLEMFNMTNVIDKIDEAGSNFTFSTETGEVDLRSMHMLHGSLMLIAWGFLLPMGAVFARFFKHRPKGLWYDVHKGCQIVGLIMAIIGWYIALTNFSALSDVGFVTYRHAVCGMTTMVLGILQPLNAILRPHPPEEGESKSQSRAIWEVIHKGSGYVALALASATIILGTLSLPDPADQTKFQVAYFVGCIGALVLGLAWMVMDKKKYPEDEKD